ncbi:MAG TPA: hypothetical protein VLG47_06545 [Candidatus Saccharimonadales bacterium]|nr:hypothetical protein [Candidatus Saccharimonadales bacterium]
MTLIRDNARGFFRFRNLSPKSYEDPDVQIELLIDESIVRYAMISALLAIPHRTFEDQSQGYDLRGAVFHPGYFEVVLIGDKSKPLYLTPKFIDYSNKTVFQPPSYE